MIFRRAFPYGAAVFVVENRASGIETEAGIERLYFVALRGRHRQAQETDEFRGILDTQFFHRRARCVSAVRTEIPNWAAI